MTISVKYYAKYREITGLYIENIEEKGIDLDGVLEFVKEKHPKLRKEEGMMVVVNGKYTQENLKLNDGDSILLFPPVSGG